jgi:hypothetical protein
MKKRNQNIGSAFFIFHSPPNGLAAAGHAQIYLFQIRSVIGLVCLRWSDGGNGECLLIPLQQA